MEMRRIVRVAFHLFAFSKFRSKIPIRWLNPRRRNTKKRSQSIRADINFPVSKVCRHLKRTHHGVRIGRDTAIFLAAVLEYVVAEVIENASIVATGKDVKRITPQHIQQAIQSDHGELDKLFGGVGMNRGGVISSIHSQLLPKTRRSKKNVEE